MSNVRVAIVGIGCRFPGGVTDPAGFWRLLCEGKDVIRDVPPDRYDIDRFYDARPAQPGRTMARRGGFLDRIDEFDAAFFGISPREAERIDPQQRLLCEIAWEALEDAGLDARALAGSRTGVFVGQWLNDFEGRLFAHPEAFDFYTNVGNGRYASSGRISFVLDLRGPSVTLDTACSASLTAVHMAAKSIESGESELCLAGGVNVILQPHATIGFSQARMIAPDGRCKFGDASANGYVRAEAAGLVVLKRVDRALADGDRIYAVVRGSAVAQDGKTSGSLGTVSLAGQIDLVRAACRDAGVAPGRLSYVEAHGTGTQGGDPVELGALGTVLGEGRAPGQRALVGSVKTNIGHAEAAAGIAGLVKAALALHHGEIPASLHFVDPNPKVAWSDLPFEIPRARTDWPRSDGPRLAGVNSFGVTGSNAHLVLEEAPPTAEAPAAGQGRPSSLLALSARSREALGALAGRYAELLEREDGPALADVCWSAAARRTPLELRAAFVAGGRSAMAGALRRFAAGEPAAAEGEAFEARRKVVFVAPGQGAQWVGMGRELAAREPVFRAALERCEQAAGRWIDARLMEQLHLDPGSPGYRMEEIDVLQPVLASLSIAYAELWRSFGVEPDAVIGHSMGEAPAAYLAGILDLEQAMHVICRRSGLLRRMAGKGAMALVELSMEEAQARIGAHADRVAVGGNNSPRVSILSGDAEPVAEIVEQLKRDGIFCRPVKSDVASHCPQVAPIAAALSAELEGLAPSAGRVAMYSTVLGRRAVGRELDAAYWGRNVRQTVLFGRTVGELLQDGATTFIELGPHPVLLPSIQQQAQSTRHKVTAVACGKRGEPEQATLLAAVGALWASGDPVAFDKLTPERGRNVQLPLYPWQRERHWVAAAEVPRPGANDGAPEERPDDESLGWLHRLTWAPAPLASARSAQDPGTWVVAASDPAASAPVASALKAAGARVVEARIDALGASLGAVAAGASLRGLVVLASEAPGASYLPIFALQALAARSARDGARLWLVTRGAQAVDGAPRGRVSVEQGALWGAGRVVAEEHPDVWGGMVDLDPSASPGEDAEALARHLLDPGGEEQVALRGAARFALRLAPFARPAAHPPFRWRTDAAYLVTGGLGGAGLEVALALAKRGVRRLVLLGRTPLPARETWSSLDATTKIGRRVAAVRAIEAAGAAVHLAVADVGDEAQLRRFLDRYAAEAWPPIRGVFHAAVALENHLSADMTPAAFDAVLRPKLRGAELLDRLLPDVDVFVLFSSLVGYVGQGGEGNYAAANAGLDALACDRQARGLPALSVAWGVWDGTTLGRAEVVQELGRQGIHGSSAERATALLVWLCAGKEPTIGVMPVDWEAFRRARRGRGERLYGGLLKAQTNEHPGEEPELAALLAKAAPPERRQILERVVKETVAKVLRIAPSRVDSRQALGSLGLTSLMAMELRNHLEAALGRSLSATLAFNYPTVSALAEFLAGAPAAATAPVTVPPLAEVSALAAEDRGRIAELSDEDAARELRASRSRGAR